ncbi:MAG: metallophosphoesterase family protein [Coriobacteriia bacterium]
MRRIAIFSDIHANLPALDAVLGDIDRAGVTERYCLGDLVGYGPFPAETIDRVRGLGIPVVQGNYDEGIGSRRGDCGCYYPTAQAREDGAASYAFTSERVDDARAAYLLGLLPHVRLEHEGARIMLAHGSPRRVNEYLLLDRTDEQLARLAAGAAADIVCVGHVHVAYHRAMPAAESADRHAVYPPAEDFGTAHYVSSGSVGKPKDGDWRAGWVELVLGEQAEVTAASGDHEAARVGFGPVWLGARCHRVAYDIDATVAAMRAAGLPETLVSALRQS